MFLYTKVYDKQLLNTWICCDYTTTVKYDLEEQQKILMWPIETIGQGQHLKLIDARLLPHLAPTDQLNLPQFSISIIITSNFHMFYYLLGNVS